MQKTAIPLDRANFIQRCRTDRTVLEFVASSVLASAKLGIRNAALDALFAASAVGFIRTFDSSPDENAVGMLLPLALDMARSKGSPDVQAAAYIVLLQLASQVQLSSQAADGVIEVVARHRQRGDQGQLAVRTVLYLCLTQSALSGFSTKTFKHLVDLEPEQLWTAAEAMVRTEASETAPTPAAVSAVCARFVAFFLDRFLADSSWVSDEYRAQLEKWLLSDRLPRIAVEAFVRSFVRRLAAAANAADEDDSLAAFLPIASALESKWRAQVYSALDAAQADHTIRRIFRADAGNVYAAPKSQANLVVDLNSVDRAVRLGSLQHLFSQLADGKGDAGLEELARDNVMSRLQMEDDREVLLQVLSWPGLADLFETDRESLEAELRRLTEKHESKKVREAAFKVLALSCGSAEAVDKGSLGFLLGNLLVTKDNNAIAVSFVQSVIDVMGKSSKTLLASLLKGIKPHYDRVVKETGNDSKGKVSKEVWATFNRALVDLVASNAAKRSDRDQLTTQLLAVVSGTSPVATLPVQLFALLVLCRMLAADTDEDVSGSRLAMVEAAGKLVATHRGAVERHAALAPWSHGLADEAYFAEVSKTEASVGLLGQAAVAAVEAIVSAIGRPEDRSIVWASVAGTEDEPYSGTIRAAFLMAVTGENLSHYRFVVETLFSKHLETDALDFLSSFWFLGDRPVPRLVDRTIRMMTAKITESRAESDISKLVAPALCFLADPSPRVRAATVALLNAVAERLEDAPAPAKMSRGKSAGAFAGGPPSFLATFLTDLRGQSAEFTADGAHAAKYFADYFNDSEDEGTELVLAWLVGSLATPSASGGFREGLLELLQGVHSRAKASALVGFIESLVSSTTLDAQELAALLQLALRSVDAEEINSAHSKFSHVYFGLLSLDGYPTMARESKEAGQEAIMDALVSGVFVDLSEDRQADVFAHILHLATHASHRIVQYARSCLRRLPALDMAIQSRELKLASQALFNDKKVAASGESRKKARTASSDFPLDSAARDWQYLMGFLEYLQYGSKSEPSKDFIVGLFGLLASLIAGNEPEHTSTEYARQLTIDALKRCLEAHDHNANPIEDSLLQMDSIVQCLRSSDNPQTHSDVLILLTVIAKTHPELVLHNVMPVFTFMGTNMLRQDDNYSFYVIRETLATLIPRLVEGQNARTRLDAVRQAKPVIQVFVDALHHIPSHRRLNLFVILVESLGPDQFLDVVFMRLLEKVVAESALPASHGGASKENLVEFGLSLASAFGIGTRMNTVVALLASIEELSTVAVGSKASPNMVSTVVFELDSHSEKQLRQFRMVVTDFVGRLLSGKDVISQLAPEADVTGEKLGISEEKLLAIVELLLRIITRLSSDEANLESSHLGRFWKAMFKLTYTVLGKVNDLLSLPAFLKVVRQLFGHESLAIRKKVAAMFGDKVFPDKWAPSRPTVGLFKDAFEQLLQIVRTAAPGAEDSDEYGVLQRIAMKAISTLAEKLHEGHAELFGEAIPSILGDHALASSKDDQVVAAMEALASLCRSLGPRALGQLPKFMPILLVQLKEASSVHRMRELPGLQCTLEIVERFPQFMGPYAADLFGTLLADEFVGTKGGETGRQAIDVAEKIRIKLAVTVPPRNLLPVLATQLDKAIARSRASVTALYRALTAMVGAMSLDGLIATYKALFKVFARGFDLRRLTSGNSSWTSDQVDATEAEMIEAFVSVVLKLNESLFKPMFLKLVEWSHPDATKAPMALARGRQLLFYKLVESLLDNLKTLFVPYMSLILDFMTEILAAGAADAEAQAGSWIHVVGSLSKSFAYDAEGVWKQDSRTENVMKLLVEQIDPKGVSKVAAAYVERMRSYLVPCIAEYAASVATEKNNKALNQALLNHCRSSDVEVRLTSLWCLQAIWEKAGEDFLPLLPQTVPVLAELLEDDDAGVERAAKELALKIQELLGEDIMSYMSK